MILCKIRHTVRNEINTYFCSACLFESHEISITDTPIRPSHMQALSPLVSTLAHSICACRSPSMKTQVAINVTLGATNRYVYRIAGGVCGHLFRKFREFLLVTKIFVEKFCVPCLLRVARPRGCGLVLA